MVNDWLSLIFCNQYYCESPREKKAVFVLEIIDYIEENKRRKKNFRESSAFVKVSDYMARLQVILLDTKDQMLGFEYNLRKLIPRPKRRGEVFAKINFVLS